MKKLIAIVALTAFIMTSCNNADTKAAAAAADSARAAASADSLAMIHATDTTNQKIDTSSVKMDTTMNAVKKNPRKK